MTINFGEHLTIDGYGGDYDKLNSEILVLHCLHELPELLGMKKLAIPSVYFAQGNGDKDPGGWTGFVVIEGSLEKSFFQSCGNQDESYFFATICC